MPFASALRAAVLLSAYYYTVDARNCTIQAIHDVLQPLESTPNFAACQTDSNYTMLSFVAPSRVQTRGFCASSACQALLSATLSSNALPDCHVVAGVHALKLSDAVATVASKCAPATEVLKLEERAVDKSEIRSKAQRASGHVATVLGHSAPMDEVGEVAGALLTLLRE